MSYHDRMLRELEKAEAEEPLTPVPPEEYARMMAEISAELDKGKAPEWTPFQAEERASQAFIDTARCVRWGSGEDACIHAFDHLGPCVDSQGRSTLTLAADILRGRK